MPRATELLCTWQGFAGFGKPCHERARYPLGPTSTYREAREHGWSWIHDERLEASAINMLDPERPRYVTLCPRHAVQWCQWHGTRYEVPPARALSMIREHNLRQQMLFADDEQSRSTVGALHATDGDGK